MEEREMRGKREEENQTERQEREVERKAKERRISVRKEPTREENKSEKRRKGERTRSSINQRSSFAFCSFPLTLPFSFCSLLIRLLSLHSLHLDSDACRERQKKKGNCRLLKGNEERRKRFHSLSSVH